MLKTNFTIAWRRLLKDRQSVLTAAMTLLVTFVSIGWQSARAAWTNPIRALRAE